MNRTDVVIAVMARAPSGAGKTRLLGPLGVSDGEPLRRALLADTLETVARVEGVDLAIVYTPPGSSGDFSRIMPCPFHLLPQRDGDLGDRLSGAFDDLLRLGYGAAVIIGSDLPTIPASYLALAADRLRARAAQVVIGPATDGGYYLLGLTSPAPGLFVGMPWSTDQVLRLTIARAAGLGLQHHVLPEWHDVDAPEDLAKALREGASGAVGRHIRAWAESAPVDVRAAGNP